MHQTATRIVNDSLRRLRARRGMAQRSWVTAFIGLFGFLLFACCSGGAEPWKLRHSPDPRPELFTGRVEGSDALVAVAVDAGQAMVVVCGGPGTAASHTAQFFGTVRDGRLAVVTPAPDPSLAKLTRAMALSGAVSTDVASGSLTLDDGTQRRWTARRPQTGAAGLYKRSTPAADLALIVTDDGASAGVVVTNREIRPVVRQADPVETRPGDAAYVGFHGDPPKSWIRLEPVSIYDVMRWRIRPRISRPWVLLQVKFRDELRADIIDSVALAFRNLEPIDVGHFEAVMDTVHDEVWMRMHEVKEERLDQMRSVAQLKLGRPTADLNSYFILALPIGNPVIDLLARLDALDFVDRATYMPSVRTADVPDFTLAPEDVSEPYQSYLGAMSAWGQGIESLGSWSISTGAGVTICDVEYDFNPDHPDLGDVEVIGEHSTFPDAWDGGESSEHGTASIGVFRSLDDGQGTIGIAHGADVTFCGTFDLVEVFGVDFPIPVVNIAGAVIEGAAELSTGDVLLIEQQVMGPNSDLIEEIFGSTEQAGLVAAEWDRGVFDAIETATANGIVVVEPAGNGGEDYDSEDFEDTWNRDSTFDGDEDSGAIMVGAGNDFGFPSPFTNFGDRVDVQAWGQLITTTSMADGEADWVVFDEDDDQRIYRHDFGGTSGASAMVAGIAAQIQSAFREANGHSATSVEMRSLLKRTGTPQQLSEMHIGPLPNVRSALIEVLGDVPMPVLDPDCTTCDGWPGVMRVRYGPGTDFFNCIVVVTMDGSEPTEDNGDWAFDTAGETEAVYLRAANTLFKARTIMRFEDDDGDLLESVVRMQRMVFVDDSIPLATFDPPAGDYTGEQEIEFDCSVSDPVLFWYLIDSNIDPVDRFDQPGYPDRLYYDGFAITHSCTIKVRPYVERDGWRIPGRVSTATYTIH